MACVSVSGPMSGLSRLGLYGAVAGLDTVARSYVSELCLGAIFASYACELCLRAIVTGLELCLRAIVTGLELCLRAIVTGLELCLRAISWSYIYELWYRRLSSILPDKLEEMINILHEGCSGL
jgi:hypothetical protein